MCPRQEQEQLHSRAQEPEKSVSSTFKSSHFPPRLHRWLHRSALLIVVIALVFVTSAWGLSKVCKIPAPINSCSESVPKKRPWPFGRKEVDEHLPFELEERSASFCTVAWETLNYLPRVPVISYPDLKQHIECPETKKRKRIRNPFKMIASKLKLMKRKRNVGDSSSEFHSLYSEDWKLSPSQIRIMEKLSEKVKDLVSEGKINTSHWGGPGGPDWWQPRRADARHGGVDSVSGGRTLASYLKIMHWPEDLRTNFPFKMCAQGCDATTAISHTAQWRAEYKPWLVTPSAVKENSDGFVYVRGHSPSLKGDDSGHSVVWYRLGMHKVSDPEAYFRAIFNALDFSIADNLRRSHSKVGKYNVVIDGNHFRFSMMPSVKFLKRNIVMMQDHFPDRLGVVFLANISRPGEFLVNLVMPFLSSEVREKIKLLPHNEKRRLDVLEKIVDKDLVPDYLGGSDSYRLDTSTYYPSRLRCTESEGRAYLKTMPYHA